MIGYYLVSLSIIFGVAANFFLKKGATSGDSDLQALLNVNLFYGLALLGFTFITYYLALSKISLNTVYPTITALSIVAITIMSYYVFKEPLTIKHSIAIIIILCGVMLMYS